MAQFGRFDQFDEFLETQTVEMGEYIYEAFVDELATMVLKHDLDRIAHAGERFAHWVGVLGTLEISGVISKEDAEVSKKSMRCELKQYVLNGGDFNDDED